LGVTAKRKSLPSCLRASRLKTHKPLSYRPRMKADLLDAIDAALAGNWDRAHQIAQQRSRGQCT
jgi:hypothetical protein